MFYGQIFLLNRITQIKLKYIEFQSFELGQISLFCSTVIKKMNNVKIKLFQSKSLKKEKENNSSKSTITSLYYFMR